MKRIHELGQNFLTDAAIAADIARAANLQKGDLVWEIGPGMGILTKELLAYNPQLTAFELDRRLIFPLQELFGKQLHLVHADILKVNWPDLLPESGLKLVSNLPYQITSPLLSLIERHHQSFSQIVLMLQKEVGERLTAKAGSKAYAAITLRLGLVFDIESLFIVPAHLFDPVPKVESMVLRLSPRQNPPAIKKPENFYKLVKWGFSSRRKTLKNNLKAYFPAEKLKWLQEQSGINLSRRAESLDETEFILLADLL